MHPSGRSRRDRVLMSIDTDQPRDATTHFELIETFADCTLVRVVLDTGRTHQIRVHMAAIGHPVCGDRQYGHPDRHGLERQFLHAARLAFPHPVTAEEIDVRSPLPEDLAKALERVRAAAGVRHSRSRRLIWIRQHKPSRREPRPAPVRTPGCGERREGVGPDQHKGVT